MVYFNVYLLTHSRLIETKRWSRSIFVIPAASSVFHFDLHDDACVLYGIYIYKFWNILYNHAVYRALFLCTKALAHVWMVQRVRSNLNLLVPLAVGMMMCLNLKKTKTGYLHFQVKITRAHVNA